jgi:hypothetical protein
MVYLQISEPLCGTLRRMLRNKTRRDTILRFYNMMAVPVLSCGSENWAMNRKDRILIETAEIKFLRYDFWAYLQVPCELYKYLTTLRHLLYEQKNFRKQIHMV